MVNIKPIAKGEKFGYLTTLGISEKRGRYYFEKCLCDCGNIKWASRNHLRQGRCKSCGCLLKETSKKNLIELNTKHGMYGDKFYNTYIRIHQRCTNKRYPHYKRYGGRGIKCLRNSFEDFKNDMYESYLEHVEIFGEDETTIDRIDVNGHYCKENCRWATNKEQQNNKTNNRIIIYKGKKYTLQQLSEFVGINRRLIHERLKRGRDINRACEEPVHEECRNKKSYLDTKKE